jgi:GNAT superfamily N-acetyltransferase
LTAAKAGVTAPAPLHADHETALFRTGKHETLGGWLKRRALFSEGLSARTYVICDTNAPQRVVGYYAISTAMERRIALPSARLRRGMPEQVPLLLIGRLALDASWQGKGLGSELLADALRRCLAVCEMVGTRAVVAHAIDDEAAQFYLRHGFVWSALGARTLLMPMESIRTLFSD